MAKRYVPVDDLTGAVTEYVRFYTDAVNEEVKEIVKDLGEEGRDKLKVEGSFQNRSGKYRKGWKMTYEDTRYALKAIVHNKVYQLTHLLESGHAKYLWGRDTGEMVRAFPHIEKVNEEVQEKFVREVERRLNDL